MSVFILSWCVGVQDNTGATFVRWWNHNRVVLFQVLKGFLHFLRDVRLGLFSLLKDVVNRSPYGVCLF